MCYQQHTQARTHTHTNALARTPTHSHTYKHIQMQPILVSQISNMKRGLYIVKRVLHVVKMDLYPHCNLTLPPSYDSVL